MPDSSHSSPTASRTPWGLLVLACAALAVLGMLVFQAFAPGASAPMSAEAIADRLHPVGAVALGAAPVNAGPRTGEAVFKSICAACHDIGAAGAPKTGDKALWAPRLAQGFDTLVNHAVNGFNAMPARGGNPALDPLEVARAVAFLGNQAGANFKEPDAPAKQ